MTLDAAFAYYADLGRRPGWGAYVIDQARALAAEHPVLFAGLPQLLTTDNPAITQQKVLRIEETRANTYRLEVSRFGARAKGAR